MAAAFSTLDEFRTLLKEAPIPDAEAVAAAGARNGQLTKPPGALGRLEDLAIWFSGWRGAAQPALSASQVVVFAGNHGVAAQGVSSFPPEVTEQMVLNFQHGGAAINQLCNTFGTQLDVYALSLDRPTEDFTKGPAMSEPECVDAIRVGWASVNPDVDLLVAGEMGIGNTTSAAAICTALFGGDARSWTGRGTGVEGEAFENKCRVVTEGIALHASAGDGLEMLRCLGGREVAAMAGAIARARYLRIPVILDGFICCAAAACLHSVEQDALDHTVAGHQSAEGAHQKLLEKLGKKPILSLGLRLGEASGGALAIGVLQAAIACHSGMATFAEAGVADG
ncbi:MAG: nicotinate-nucleotide--dimethylbenzimidazole phosphoribosyltransferase [Paracoccaceae bacterium]